MSNCLSTPCQFALRICCCLFSKKSCQISCIIGILNCVLSTVAADCKVMRDKRRNKFSLYFFCSIFFLQFEFRISCLSLLIK